MSGEFTALGVATFLLNAVAATGQDSTYQIKFGKKVIHACVTGTGAVAAVVDIYGTCYAGSTDIRKAVKLGTVSPNGTNVGVDSIAFDAPWPWIFANCTSISGTDATLDVMLGG